MAREGNSPGRRGGLSARRGRRFLAAALGAAVFLGGCQRVTKEQRQLEESGIALLEASDYSGALSAFEQAIGKSKRVTDFELDVLKYRAEAEFGLEDYDAALYTYGVLEQLDGERAEYLYLEAVCLARKKDTDAAAIKLDAGLKKDESAPGAAQARRSLGDAYREAGNPDEAQKIYAKLMETGQADASLYNQMGLACIKSEDYEQAFRYLTQGLALPDGGSKQELSFNRAVCLEYLGRYEEALSAFLEYAAAYGESAEAEHEIAFLESR